jgi:hydrogenase maturation protein HypF
MRKRILIRGTVQGVGFRPFVYNLAKRLSINGFVRNSESGVEIEAEGSEVPRFLAELQTSAPSLAKIAEIQVADLEIRNEAGFRILRSGPQVGDFALVPPDVATCDDCLRDFTQGGNRRYGYPFTNCTNCGPRYTIIQDVPYDRAATTMAVFPMCEACQAEYDDPDDRRFHAQPNACPVCGPQLSARLEQVGEWLGEGLIVAIKGLGGYHLACNAANDSAVRLLRERKRRGDKPFAIMVRSIEEVRRFCRVNDEEEALLLGSRRPIVLLARRDCTVLSPAIAPGNSSLGVMLPYTPLHHLLFAGSRFTALVMTSGNLSEEPIVSREEELARLAPLADRFLTRRRLGNAHLPRPNAGAAPCTRLCAGPFRPGSPYAESSGGRRRTQEHFLPDYRSLCHSQPTPGRPGELRDPGFFSRDSGAHAAILPRASGSPGA